MDFQSAMETFAEAWVAANSKPLIADPSNGPQSEALALTTRDRDDDGGGRTPDQRAASPIATPSETPDKASPGKNVPVHCVVEAVWTVEEWEGGRGRGGLEADSYVIIPVGTAFADLVPVALARLGYSSDNAAAAKGSVVIKNWKPLSFDHIADSPLMTVGDILGELSTVATLRIRIFRTRPSVLAEMKDKLLKLLLVQSQSLLVSLDEAVLSQILSGSSEPSEETRRKFETWWGLQTGRGRGVPPPWYQPPPADPAPQPPPPPPAPQPPPQSKDPHKEDLLHPAIQTVQNQYPTQKTRMRTSFDPELELPKLQRWFVENPHPSRQQIQQYVKELNSLDSRRGRKPLDVNNVVYWFKNARAAQKRAELRTVAPGLSHVSMNGYNSSSESPSDAGGGLLSKSPGSHEDEDLEDVEDRPASAPLSLTTRLSSPRVRFTPTPPSLLPVARGHGLVTASLLQMPDRRPQSRDGIKSEPGDEDPSNNNIINNNNNNNKEDHDVDDDDDEEEVDEGVSDTEDKYLMKREKNFRTEFMSRGGFPMVNNMFSQSMLYMGHYMGHGLSPQPPPLNLSSLQDERRKRNRTFIDPVSEVPRLEQWFALNTHPSHNLILKYTDDLNRMPYRQKFPPLEPKNVQFWFKNRRAKCKRLKMSLFEQQTAGPQPFPLAPISGAHDPYQNHKALQEGALASLP